MTTRRELPDTFPSINHRFSVGGVKGYIIVGLYHDGTPGRVTVKIAKEGSTLSGLIDGWALTTSLALQYGVPLEVLVSELAYSRFEPAGYTEFEAIEYANSLLDYIVRWLAVRFLSKDVRLSIPPGEGPPCPHCGVPQVPNGAGWTCTCSKVGKAPKGR